MKNTHFSRSKFFKLPGLIALALFLFAFTPDANASHYRFGNITWTAGAGNTITFKVKQAYRVSFYGTPTVGDVVPTETLFFGDGGSTPINLVVLSVNPGEDWFYGEYTVSHTYASPGTYTAYYQSCCRISTLQNNSDGNFRSETVVNVGSGNNSPLSSIPVILNMGQGLNTANYQVFGFDPDGDNIQFRLATVAECQGTQPAGLSISPTGLISFNTVPTAIGQVYSAIVAVEDLDNNGHVKSKILVDFLIKIVSPSTPPVFGPNTPTQGATLVASCSQPFSFTVSASGSGTVTLSATSVPLGATFSPALPASGSPSISSVFNWTPTNAALGFNIISFTATDNTGAQATRSFGILVLDNSYDGDGDGYGQCSDCDDSNPNINPGAVEICDGLDNDCDGFVDEGVGYTVCQDGAFSPLSGSGTSVFLGDDQVSGSLPIGFSFNFMGGIYSNFYISSNGFITFSPGQSNGCCGGQSIPNSNNPNNLIALAWDDLHPGQGGNINYFTTGTAPNRILAVNFVNVPLFGGGGAVTSQILLYEATGVIEIHTTSATNINPGTMGIENINGTDAYPVPGRNSSSWTIFNDYVAFLPCSSGGSTFYADADGDGFGDPAVSQTGCFAPPGYVTNDGDCDDSDAAINPNATEVCDGVDNDCDGSVDEGFDADGDGVANCFDNCPATPNSDQADEDCDGFGDVCDQCPGGDDGVDNNGDGHPDCAVFPGFGNLPAAWTCSNNQNNGKVYICHDGQTICVSENAVVQHLTEHEGDYIGPCGNSYANCSSQGLSIPGGLSNGMVKYMDVQSIDLLPNPAHNTVSIQLNGLKGSGTLTVSDYLGRAIWSQQVEEGQVVVQLDLTTPNFENGIYIVSLTSQDGERTTKRLVVAK